MDFLTGERVNLNSDASMIKKPELDHDQKHKPLALSLPTFIGDIQEHRLASCPPPVALSLKSTPNGFPAHRKRVPRISRFKQYRTAQIEHAADSVTRMQTSPKTQRVGLDTDPEKRAIDEENKRTLAEMSIEEIEQHRHDLMSSLSTELLQKLLIRSNLNDGSNEQDLYLEDQMTGPSGSQTNDEDSAFQPSKTTATTYPMSTCVKKILPVVSPSNQRAPAPHIEDGALSTAATQLPDANNMLLRDAKEIVLDTGILPIDTRNPTPNSVHFPSPGHPPDLDPNDPAFLKNMHDKYFPSLRYNPTELSWMSPIDFSDVSSPYHPSQTALKASQLRFDFQGALLAPSIARSIPSDMGLHHHAEAPEAAGYTIPELAVLARSKVAAQRCMAFKTLGRIIFRLGQGGFGMEKTPHDADRPVRLIVDPDAKEDAEVNGDDVGSVMRSELWKCIEDGRVLETMTEEANRTKGHLTARTFAQEALWNWRRGGARTRYAV